MKTILVVDDSETARLHVINQFKAVGYNTIEAEDGVKGIQAVTTYNPDIIICDVNMPEMDGLTMCEHLKQMNVNIPIIMMTTESSMDMKVRGKNAGVLAWVTKPFNPDKILAAIKKIIGDAN